MKRFYSAPIAELIDVEMDDLLEKASFYNADIDDPDGLPAPGPGGGDGPEEWGDAKPGGFDGSGIFGN